MKLQETRWLLGMRNATLDPDEVLEAAEEQMFGLGNAGFCLNCGEELEGIDPDARGDECECCGSQSVYGAQELVMMGYAG